MSKTSSTTDYFHLDGRSIPRRRVTTSDMDYEGRLQEDLTETIADVCVEAGAAEYARLVLEWDTSVY